MTCSLFQINVCDINCCCDLDCTEHHFKVFSSCTDHKTDKEKDRWYCHEKPFFKPNDTRFIVGKIVDSLFCVASDNLPPVYSATSHLVCEGLFSLIFFCVHNNILVIFDIHFRKLRMRKA